MPISVQEEQRLFPRNINGARIIWNNSKERITRIPAGRIITVERSTGKLYDDVGAKIGSAYFYDITAYFNCKEYYKTSIRTTRWISGKPRWMISRRLAAKIRRASQYVR